MHKCSITLALAGTILLAGCTTTRTTTMPVMNNRGVQNGSIHITMNQKPFDQFVSAIAVDSNGEVFQGQLVAKHTETSGFSSGSSGNHRHKDKTKIVLFSLFDDEGDDDAGPDNYNSKTYSSEANAVLIGNQGHSMSCNFTYNNAINGFGAGGIGECLISDGRKVPVNF